MCASPLLLPLPLEKNTKNTRSFGCISCLHIKRRFSIKPKDSNSFASYIAQRYETHKKRADQSLSGAPLVRMTLVFECKFSTSSTPSLSNRPFLLASNFVFCFRCISLKQISNEFQLSLRLPLVDVRYIGIAELLHNRCQTCKVDIFFLHSVFQLSESYMSL